jgi:hypothetical protein
MNRDEIEQAYHQNTTVTWIGWGGKTLTGVVVGTEDWDGARVRLDPVHWERPGWAEGHLVPFEALQLATHPE